jgi:preprotein translocase subunit SecG
MLRGFILAVHVLLALMIIGLVLLQRGKGAEAGAGFGSGASGTVFGARGTSTLFSKLTGIFAGLFFATSLLLAYMGTRAPGEPSSVLERSLLSAPAPGPHRHRLLHQRLARRHPRRRQLLPLLLLLLLLRRLHRHRASRRNNLVHVMCASLVFGERVLSTAEYWRETVCFDGAPRRLVFGVRSANPVESFGRMANWILADVAKLVDALV